MRVANDRKHHTSDSVVTHLFTPVIHLLRSSPSSCLVDRRAGYASRRHYRAPSNAIDDDLFCVIRLLIRASGYCKGKLCVCVSL
jgi:hypothetical protein